mgnify:CR=1 FL=1
MNDLPTFNRPYGTGIHLDDYPASRQAMNGLPISQTPLRGGVLCPIGTFESASPGILSLIHI